jgi:pre-mRNA cleavage complex 2 protein Pcf11
MKLPALYLLDSICKNVGSPYPLLFGRNIYRTFMDAYTLVEPPLRRKLEELLFTWKQPPPTGLTSSPVFAVDVTRKIDTALLKAKTLAVQLEQRRQREMAASGLIHHQDGPPMNYPSQPGWNGNSVRAFNGSFAHSFQNMVNVYPPQMGPSNQDFLLGEIRNLLTIVAHTLLLNPADEEAARQAAALNQLQTILQTSVLPYDQVEAVRQQLASLPIQQPRPQATATPPIPEPVPQDRMADTLLQSLRAAGLLGSSISTPPPVPQNPTIHPLAVNSNAANLRNSDLELTSSSLQK